MKTQWLTLISLAALLTAISCNEQVSSEVENAGSVTTGGTGGGTTGSTSGGSSGTPGFKVTLETTPLAGFKIHRTGYAYDASTLSYTSRKTANCEVTAPTGSLSNDLFDAEAAFLHDDKEYDISCFVEVEELSLYLNELKFKVESTGGACDSIGFRPYGYFSYLPGSSTTTYKTISCPDGVTNAPNATGAHAGLNCGQYRNQTAGGADAFVANITTPESEEDLCRFDYTDEDGPNCDPGIVTIKQYNYIEDPGAAGTYIADTLNPLTTRTVRCGGKVSNCVSGAIKKVQGGTAPGTNYTDVIYHTNPLADGTLTKTYTLPALVQTESSADTRLYSNYRRNLAHPEIDYVTSVQPINNVYKNAFDPIANGLTLADRTFDPNLLEFYSQNLMMDGATPYVTGISTYSDAAFYKSTPYASEPFMSLNSSAYPISPFYTFYCFDPAYEYKARIRLVVREWDRKFANPTSSAQFDYLSDVFNNATAYQDNYYNDSYARPLNNVPDWDDFLFMTRDAGFYNPSATDYAPAAGWYHTSLWLRDLFTGDEN